MKSQKNNSHHDKHPIKDNPSTKKLEGEMEGMSALLDIAKMFGVSLGNDIPDIKQMQVDLEKLARLPDEFNSAFACKGWIAYESFNVKVMEKAVELYKQGDEKGAEDEIMAYYNADNIKTMIVNRGSAVEAYRPRKQLTQYALTECLAPDIKTRKK